MTHQLISKTFHQLLFSLSCQGSAVAVGAGGPWVSDGCLCPPILGYFKFFVLFEVPHNDKTSNNSIKKLRFYMQNNVQFNMMLVRRDRFFAQLWRNQLL